MYIYSCLSHNCLHECSGRYSGIAKEERICKLCDPHFFESVEHCILHCYKFSAERHLHFHKYLTSIGIFLARQIVRN